MLKKITIPLGFLLALSVATAANAAEIPVVSTISVNLRAGPALSYPVVDRLPAGAHLVLHGCVAGYAWCEV